MHLTRTHRRVRRGLARTLLTVLTVIATAALVPVGAQATSGGHHHHRYQHLQMNLCLSGLAGCFEGTEYPKVLDEAVEQINTIRPDSVMIDEACSGDATELAERTGMHASFTDVIYKGTTLDCVDPTGRGHFGLAVLTRARPTGVTSAPYDSQFGNEERRYLCVNTTARVTVCGTHLAVGGDDGSDAQVNQDNQCLEFGAILAKQARHHRVIASGDMNRQDSCAPRGYWTQQDTDSAQLPGIQHIYGEFRSFTHPASRVVEVTYTDHGYLLGSARLR